MGTHRFPQTHLNVSMPSVGRVQPDVCAVVMKQQLNVNWEVESFDVMGHLWHNGFGNTMELYGTLWNSMEHYGTMLNYRTLCYTMEYYATLCYTMKSNGTLWMGDHNEFGYKIRVNEDGALAPAPQQLDKYCC